MSQTALGASLNSGKRLHIPNKYGNFASKKNRPRKKRNEEEQKNLPRQGLRLGVCFRDRKAEAAGRRCSGGRSATSRSCGAQSGVSKRYVILLRARESAIHHAFEHRNQRISRQRVVNIGETLLP